MSKDALLAAEAELRAMALALPEAFEDFPWGERVIKVRKKIFVFLGIVPGEDERLRVGVKLTSSHGEAMSLPFVVPTGYGLGRAGWVTATFSPGEQPMTGLLAAWIRESYRNVAPKRLAALVEG
jgi:predicted DNA-binding protein (MmcQ/YjbR family)